MIVCAISKFVYGGAGMGSVNKKMRGNGTVNIQRLADLLKDQIDAELISENWRGLDGFNVVLLSFERLFFRNGSYASLAILLTEYGDMQTADIVASGGGEGLFNISWGANSDFADMASALLEENGFEEEETDEDE